MLKKITIAIGMFFIMLSSLSQAAPPREELKQIKKELNVHKKKLQETKKIEQNVIEDLKKFQTILI